MSNNTKFTIKKGDLSPSISEVLNIDGEPINLTGATVKFNMIDRNDIAGTPKVNDPAVVVDAAAGIVRYDWDGTDTDTAGFYLREWEITLTGGDKVTVPNDRPGYLVEVVEDLA